MSAQEHEAAFWGDCANTWHEEFKQSVYARVIGLEQYGGWPHFELAGRVVVDLGGGPVSMLLKTVGGEGCVVVDPCPYPDWVEARYAAHGIEYVREPAETFSCPSGHFDEAWIYNVLQHVDDPGQVVRNARHMARWVRIFEWTDIPADRMHPHVLRAEQLDEWAGVRGERGYGVNTAWGEVPAMSWNVVAPGAPPRPRVEKPPAVELRGV